MKINFKRRLKYFIDNGYLHGLRYLGERCGIFGKIFWLIIMIISAWQMSNIFILTIDSYLHDATSINFDTSYLHWNNTFPAVSVCAVKGRSMAKFRDYLVEFWKANNISQPKKVVGYIKLLQSYLFLSPLQPIELDGTCHDPNGTCGLNLEVLQQLFLPHSCNDFMMNVTYLGESYECEKLFQFIKTEMGYCFIANNLHSRDLDYLQLPMKYDRTATNQRLEFTYKNLESSLFNLYIHSPEDLPFFLSPGFTLRHSYSYLSIIFNTIEMVNENDVINLPIEKRECQFPQEKFGKNKIPYSYSACMSELRVHVELLFCNCTIHTSSEIYKEKYCDFQGLQCIREFEIGSTVKNLHYKKETQCVQSCLEMDISYVGETYQDKENELASVSIEILNVPTMRHIRRVAKTNLDFVVTIGGIFGLFFGASVLTVFQFIYIWCVRKF